MLLPMTLRFENILKPVKTVTSSSVFMSLALETGFVTKSIQTDFICLHFSHFYFYCFFVVFWFWGGGCPSQLI